MSTVLLDLDGVLMDHTRAAQEAIRSWLGERLTPEVEAAWFAAQDVRLKEWRDGTATWEEQRRNRLKDVLPLIGEPIGTDDELDALHRRFVDAAAAELTGEHMASATLVGRFYERLGDHAVNIAGRVCYLATGRPQRERAT